MRLKGMFASNQLSDAPLRRREVSSAWGRLTGVRLAAIRSGLWTAFLNRVPLGYEDNSGFHFEVEPSHDEHRTAALADD